MQLQVQLESNFIVFQKFCRTNQQQLMQSDTVQSFENVRFCYARLMTRFLFLVATERLLSMTALGLFLSLKIEIGLWVRPIIGIPLK